MTQRAKVITSTDLPDFSHEINRYLSMGYQIRSATFNTDRYVALLIIDKEESYTLTASREDIKVLLYDMCLCECGISDCKPEDCILSKTSEDPIKFVNACPCNPLSDETSRTKALLFQMAIESGLVKENGSFNGVLNDEV